MPKPVTLINGRSWPTQGAALAHFKDMLARYADEKTVEERTDHEDLAALIARYDSAMAGDHPSKTGCGIELFFRRRNVGEGYSTPGFWIRRTDGSETDFSYIAAVKGQPKTDDQGFYDACREAIASDIAVAKIIYFKEEGDAQGRAPCDATGELIAIDEAHMDHAWPTFSQLVMTFRVARGWAHAVPSGVLTPAQDRQTTTTFLDPDVGCAFREYHHAAAIVRVVRKGFNLAKAAGERRPKVKRQIRF